MAANEDVWSYGSVYSNTERLVWVCVCVQLSVCVR